MRSIGPKALDCPAEDRCWAVIDGSLAPENKGAFNLYTCGNHNGLSTADRKNASALIVTTHIGDQITDWMTVYPDIDGKPHKEITDYIGQRPRDAGDNNPMTEFFSQTNGKDYRGVLHYDTHPRDPLDTTSDASDNNNTNNNNNVLREHTIRSAINRAARDSEYDHYIGIAIRPLVIDKEDVLIEEPEGIWETVVWPMVCRYILDLRGEGELTGDDYYIQLYEIIAYDDSQQPPARSAISEANANTTSNHNFETEFVSPQTVLKKFRRAQVDIRQSRLRRVIPIFDGKKRARAVSVQDLRQFTTNIID
jgi:hypothetical protein